ncbi:MAG: FecR domain-containing protein, partial [Acidobacteriia bacterium]|nr:FecR domain-containing protein [Terriglobia bacterium]
MRRAPKLSQIGRMLLAAAVAGACFAQPGIPDRNAKVTLQIGRVSVLSDSGEKALFVGSLVQPRQLIITGPDGYAEFQVSDGSTFQVFADSKLVFRPHLASWEDLLDITLGRVKVMIQHLNGVPNPNRVSGPTAIISVRGTVFDVVVEDDDGTTLVSVDEGLVYVRNTLAGGNLVPLHPGEVVRVFPNQPLAVGRIDRGGILYRVLKGAEEAAY